MTVYGLHSVYAHISVSGLPACLGKQKKIPVNGLRTEQSKTKKKQKFPSGTQVYETRVPLEKTEQNRATSRTKQSI